MFLKRTVFTALAAMLVNISGGCASAEAPEPERQPKPVADAAPRANDAAPELPMRLVISDGSGNTWNLSQAESGFAWRYAPTTPERSSSGVYSGGEPATGEASSEQSVWVATEVERLMTETGEHLDARMMNRVQIERTPKDGDEKVVIVTQQTGQPLIDRLRDWLNQ
jgi:hypothetical protein